MLSSVVDRLPRKSGAGSFKIREAKSLLNPLRLPLPNAPYRPRIAPRSFNLANGVDCLWWPLDRLAGGMGRTRWIKAKLKLT
jgi:hypothetical protein